MDTFESFKECIRNLITKTYKLSYDDVYYIYLNDNYWINFADFMDLKRPPRIWSDEFNRGFKLLRDQFGKWENLPKAFKIVLKDYRWIQYEYCWGDSYYSDFIMCNPPKKPQRKYFEHKEPHKITLWDFIKI